MSRLACFVWFALKNKPIHRDAARQFPFIFMFESVDYKTFLGTLLWNLDFLFLVFLAVSCLTAITVWKRSARNSRRFLLWGWAILIGSLLVGGIWVRQADLDARQHWNSIYRYTAQAYATAFELMGHEKITPDLSAEKTPLFQELLLASQRWQADNPLVSCICTLRKIDDETYVYVLGPEVDYDGDGTYEGEMEAYAPPGTRYLYEGENDPDLVEPIATGDPSGTWFPYVYSGHQYLCTTIPLKNPDGKINSAVMVDFHGDVWIHNVQSARKPPLFATAAFLVIGAVFLLSQLKRRKIEEERMRIMLDATPLCCNFWDENLHNIDCNLEAPKLFGLSSKQEYLDRFNELSPKIQPDGEPSADKAFRMIRQAFDTGQAVFEWMHQMPNGDPVPAEITLVRVQYGEQYIVAGYTRDLRATKKMLEEKREADERTRIMLDATPLCCNFWDKDFNNIDCNLEAAKLFDLKDKQEYLDRFNDLSPEIQPDGEPSADKAGRMIKQAFETGRAVFEWMHQKLNGEQIPSEITLVRVRRDDEDIVLGYTRDLREFKKMLAESREAEERTQIMLDATPLCCNLWDENFNNIDCNLEAVKLFELKDKKEYLDRFFELSPPIQPDGRPTGEKAGENITKAFRDGYCRFDWMHQKLDGTPIPSEITLVRVKQGDKFIVAGYTRDMREFKKMLAEIDEVNERTRIMLDATPLCCNFWDENVNNVDCNLEAAKLFGLKDKQEYLDRFMELSPEYQPNGRKSGEYAAELVAKAFETGYQRFEWMHQKPDGTPIPAEITLVRVQRGDGFIVVGYTRDMREFKKMLADMREADERTQIMLDATPLCCNLWDDKFQNIDCNLEAVKLFELKDKQEYLDRFFELSPEIQPDGRPSSEKAGANITTAFRDGYCRFEWMHQKLDGTPIPSEITLVRVKRGDGFIVAGYTRDMRELKKNEKALELDRQRMNDLLELSQMTNRAETEIVDFTIKSAASLTHSNMGYVVLLEHAKDTLPFQSVILDKSLNCSLPTMTPEGTSHTLSPALTECLHTGQAVIHDNFAALPGYRVFPTGHFPVRSHMNLPILDGDRPIGIMGVGNKETPYDEKDVKQLQLVAQGLSNQLNRKRYAEKLENAKIDAEKANSAKSEFLAHMSHEIRTPLNGVIGLSDLLIGTELNSKQNEYAQLINASGKSLLFLINDILDFSKIEAGKLEIDSEVFDLPGTVESVLGILASRASGKGLEICVSFSRNMPRNVRGDSGRIRQILLNLVGNAVKFTEHGGVRIDVQLDEIRSESVLVRFNVIDTGIGIPKDRIGRLFKAFSQADASLTRTYGGTGLGLAISMKLVHLMGGDVGVESTEGVGSTFWFTAEFGCAPDIVDCLSRNREKDDPQPCPSCERNDMEICTEIAYRVVGTAHDLKGRTVLIVDDNEVQRETFNAQLSSWGMECTTTNSADASLRLLDEAAVTKKPFDLIVLDNTLDHGTGYSLANTLLEREEKTGTKPPKMILLRSLSEDFDTEFLQKTRAEVLAKPVFISALFNAVMNQLFSRNDLYGIDSGVSGVEGRQARVFKPREKESASKGRMQSVFAQQIHLLVVEDNRVNQIVAKNLLLEAGFTCDIANNGHEACSAVRKKEYDVILMDCQMPEMDGYEATDLIRKWERETTQKRTPIIALTANATKEDVQKCLDAGMDAYCSKPINPQTVIRMIEEWYEKSLSNRS